MLTIDGKRIEPRSVHRIDPRFSDALSLAVEAAYFASYEEQGGFEAGIWSDELHCHVASDWRIHVRSIDVTWTNFDPGYPDIPSGSFDREGEMTDTEPMHVEYTGEPKMRPLGHLDWWHKR